jgi:hypothetical protein
VTTYSTFDPYAPAQVRMTLSGGNLTGTSAGAGTGSPGFAVSQEGKSSGKWYCELTCTTIGNPSGICVINCLVGASGTRMAFDSTNNDGSGYFAGGGIWKDGSLLWSTDTYTDGDVICVAMDCDNKKVWYRKNGGSWRGNSSSAADPATNTNGIDMTTHMTRGRMFVGFNGERNNDVCTANFGASSFAQSVPSGFTSGLEVATPNFLASLFTGYGTTAAQAPPALSTGLSKFNLPANKDITSVDWAFNTSGTQNLKVVVYAADGASNLPGTFKGQTTALSSFVKGENRFTFSTPLQLTAADYWWGVSTDRATFLATSRAAALTDGIKHKATTYSPPDDPFPSSPSTINQVYPMLINYTDYSGAGAGFVPKTTAVT